MDDILRRIESKYGTLEKIRINDRFATFRALHNDARLFIKIAAGSLDPSVQKYIQDSLVRIDAGKLFL